MLKVKRLMYLLCIILLSDAFNICTITPFHALATEVVENNNLETIHKAEMNLIKNPIQVQYEKDKLEQLKNKKLEEMKRNKFKTKEFILTFYTSLISENSSAGAVTCQNKPLVPGGVANNVIPQNTKIYLEGYGQVVVNDKGSDEYFGVSNRLDVYIAREPGESDKQYLQRVNSYGVKKVKGYIVT